jgi:hypothetical protein
MPQTHRPIRRAIGDWLGTQVYSRPQQSDRSHCGDFVVVTCSFREWTASGSHSCLQTPCPYDEIEILRLGHNLAPISPSRSTPTSDRLNIGRATGTEISKTRIGVALEEEPVVDPDGMLRRVCAEIAAETAAKHRADASEWRRLAAITASETVRATCLAKARRADRLGHDSC